MTTPLRGVVAAHGEVVVKVFDDVERERAVERVVGDRQREAVAAQERRA